MPFGTNLLIGLRNNTLTIKELYHKRRKLNINNATVLEVQYTVLERYWICVQRRDTMYVPNLEPQLWIYNIIIDFIPL